MTGSEMPVTSANLFGAGKSYLLAMSHFGHQVGDDGEGASHALAMPFYFLAGFACELVLKAVVFRATQDERALRALSHDLRRCYEGAVEAGYLPADPAKIGALVEGLAETHSEFSFRYVPDVEVIHVPNKTVVFKTLAEMISEIESQVDVWADRQAPDRESGGRAGGDGSAAGSN